MGERAVTKVYIIRHAQAEGNLLRQAQGHTNGDITEIGMRQIKALEERFKDIPVDACYASDLRRTCTTAEAVYVPKGLPLHTNVCFREYNMGVWEGRTWDEIFENDRENSDNFNWHLEKFSVPGGETPQMVLDRFIPALRGICAEHDGQTIAVFSHGAAMRTVITVLGGGTLEDVGRVDYCDNTAVSLLEAEDGQFRVVFRDDNSHLTKAGLSTRPKIRRK